MLMVRTNTKTINIPVSMGNVTFNLTLVMEFASIILIEYMVFIDIFKPD